MVISPSLVIVDESGFRSINLAEFQSKEITFGRKKHENDIVIHSDIVSASHGKIVFHENGVQIFDFDSANHTFLAIGGHYKKVEPHFPLFSEMDDLIIRIGGHAKSVLLLLSNKTGGVWKRLDYREVIQIGRDKENDIVLDHVSVSNHHAKIEYQNDECMIEDLSRTSGLMVNAMPISKKCFLKDKDIIQITNTTLIFTEKTIIYKTSDSGTQLVVQGLNKAVGRGRRKKTILNNASCSIGNNEFVAIIGGSGAGKSTMMTAISGFDKAVTGTVLFNGLDLHQNFDALKSIIGFVPQQDIIYENLTLYKMLYYTAKMKMPDDTKKQEIDVRIHQVLDMVELSEHKKTVIKRLSGGQKKRASIAVELLADPGLFFLDEPTSGLDPGTEKNLMHTLRRLAKEQGKTVIMVTHTTQNLHLCDKILIMGNGGRICYFGSPSEAAQYFGTQDLVSIYNLVTENADFWDEKYRALHNNVSTEEAGAASTGLIPKSKKISWKRQFNVLVKRYIALIKNDFQRLALLFLQPIIIGFLLTAVASEDVFNTYEDTRSILFALSCSGIWIGMFNTIQEICKERIILRREYMTNLKLSAYIGSKYLVQGLICLIQSALLLGTFSSIAGLPEEGLFLNSPICEMYVSIFLTIYASSSLGLIVSAVSKNGDRAMATAPFLLIIQLLFSGVLFELKGMTDVISAFTVSRWSMEGLGVICDLNSLPLKLQKEYPMMEREINEMFKWSGWHLLQTWGILLIFIVVLSFVSIRLLRGLKKEK